MEAVYYPARTVFPLVKVTRRRSSPWWGAACTLVPISHQFPTSIFSIVSLGRRSRVRLWRDACALMGRQSNPLEGVGTPVVQPYIRPLNIKQVMQRQVSLVCGMPRTNAYRDWSQLTWDSIQYSPALSKTTGFWSNLQSVTCWTCIFQDALAKLTSRAQAEEVPYCPVEQSPNDARTISSSSFI